MNMVVWLSQAGYGWTWPDPHGIPEREGSCTRRARRVMTCNDGTDRSIVFFRPGTCAEFEPLKSETWCFHVRNLAFGPSQMSFGRPAMPTLKAVGHEATCFASLPIDFRGGAALFQRAPRDGTRHDGVPTCVASSRTLFFLASSKPPRLQKLSLGPPMQAQVWAQASGGCS